jgi:uncharacterized membrane protein
MNLSSVLPLSSTVLALVVVAAAAVFGARSHTHNMLLAQGGKERNITTEAGD